MNTNKLSKIVSALTSADDLSGDKPFCVENELTPLDFNLVVEEVGQLVFPLSKEYIQRLISISTKAMYGLREQTILDEKVRNTHEIKPNKLLSTINEKALTDMLYKMRETLGIGENAVLIPQLHNMLIYGPGHFFDLHQDTEKLENMVATLVVVLPTPHVGGDLTITHGKKEYIFSTENLESTNAKCIAFYSDCKHKVDKVKFGHRVCLTYNLVLNSPGLSIKNTNQLLKTAIEEYFNSKTDVEETEKSQQKLVYLFDHSYTEHSLRWYMLKGNDSKNASAIIAVAKELDLVPHLVLVDVEETWITYGDLYDDDPNPEEIDSSNISIYFWIDSNNKKLPLRKCEVEEDEICWNKATSSFDPHHREYEGYQGNYAGNIEIWYKLAAIVLWPKSNEIAMRFQLNYEEAIDLSALANEPGNEETVKNVIKHAGKYLYDSYKYGKISFEKLVNIALYVKDKKMAKSILSKFTRQLLDLNIVEQLVKLQNQYGQGFCIELLNSWENPRNYYFNYNAINNFKKIVRIALFIKDKEVAKSILSNFTWQLLDVNIVEQLFQLETQYGPTFCTELLNIWNKNNRNTLKKVDSLVRSFLLLGGHPQIVEAILNEQVKSLIQNEVKSFTRESEIALSYRINLVYETLSAIELIRNVTLLNKIVQYLIGQPELYPDIKLAQLYLRFKKASCAEFFAHCLPLKDYIVKTIEYNLSLKQRAENDWSIDTQISCGCELCVVANRFLLSKTETNKIWPLAEKKRTHVKRNIEALHLPVNLAVQRIGSPFKLVLVKTTALQENSKKICYELNYYRKLLEDDTLGPRQI